MPERYATLDAIRGIAVMGILLLNIFSFAMPQAGYANPLAYGGTEAPDIAAWFVGFVLFEGKMRGLFSLLFGASMVLIIERAEASGANGASVHMRRMFWLLVFGLAHHLFIWEGDILAQYAIAGSVALGFFHLSARKLRRWAVGLLAFSFLLHAGLIGAAYGLRASAAAPGASAETRSSYAATIASFSKPGNAGIARDLAVHRRDYAAIRTDRARGLAGSLIGVLTVFGAETLGLMLLGMLLFRNGFLAGGWSDARYRRWAWRAYLIGIPPSVALAVWNWSSGFDTLATFGTYIAWIEPFRYAVMIGHAALAMLLLRRFADSPLTARISAAGRMAFTNYLVTSLVMTSLFYGYGVALYGTLGRAELYIAVIAMWALMLGWSQPWLERFRYGPFEWAWRSLARWRIEPMRRTA